MLDRCNFLSATLSNAVLMGVKSAVSANFGSVIATDADLTGANLAGAEFRLTDLSRCQAPWANFDNTCFWHTKLVNGNLSGASFVGAELSGADFTGAVLRGCNFDGAWHRDDHPPIWPWPDEMDEIPALEVRDWKDLGL